MIALAFRRQPPDVLYGVGESSSVEHHPLITSPDVPTISDPLAAGVFFLADKLGENGAKGVDVEGF
jgi:hypothetical protein